MLAAVGLLVLAIGLGAYALHAQASLPFPGLLEISVLLGTGALVLLLAALLRRGAFWLKQATSRDIVLDGSNILYWAGDGPDPDSLRRVLSAVRKEGYHPVVWFDANAGYLIEERYAGPVRLGKIFAMPARDVFVVPKGEPADPKILATARQLKALIVTNDRYRDWSESEGKGMAGRLVKGRITGGEVSLEWPRGAKPVPRVKRAA